MSAADLAAFLRARRERLDPAALGLPRSGRRRTPGLRREEVAARAAISVTYYTFLEQGRDVHPSEQVLRSLARALELTSTETTHLLLLATNRAPEPEPFPFPELDPVTRAAVVALDPLPAYVTGPAWDVLAANESASRIWGRWDELPEVDRNMVLWVFTSERARKVMPNWDTEARTMIGRLREASARHPNNARFTEVTERILAANPMARRWWDEHQVAPLGNGIKRLWNERTGEFDAPHTVLVSAVAADTRLVVFNPAAEVIAGLAG